MRAIVFISLLLALLSSCGTYRYRQPLPNSALFHDKGEVHISGDIGSSGASAKTAISLPSHIGIMGTYNYGIDVYRVKEGEIGIGYYSHANPVGMFVVGGLGFGSNYGYSDSTYTNKVYEGDFIRPFIQFNGGVSGGTIYKGLKANFIFSCKVENFIYNGQRLNTERTKIRSNYYKIEPAFTMGVGGSIFQAELIFAFPFRPSFEGLNDYNQARTVPASIGIGMKFIIGRDKDKPKASS